MEAAIGLVVLLILAGGVLLGFHFLYGKIITLEERQDDLEENWDALLNELKDLVKK